MKKYRGIGKLTSLMCIVTLIFVTACSGGQSTAPANEAPKEQPAAPSENTSSEAPKSGALENVNIRLFNGPPQGTWRPIANMVKQVIEESIPGSTVTIEAGGGASNVIAVDSGEGDLAMAVSTSTIDGWKGLAPYTKKMENIREVGILFEMPVQLMTFDESINSIGDLKGKRVNVQQKGYSTEVLNQMILKAAGMSYEDIEEQFLGEADSAGAMRDGQIDANMHMSSLPNAVSIDLASTGKLRFIPIEQDIIDKLQAENSGILPYTMPNGSYSGQNEDVQTIATSVHLIAKKDLPEELVEAITKALVEGLPQFQSSFDFYKQMTPEVIAKDIGIPFHPGAEKYFKEANIVK